jgi:hypothetical protein
MNTHALVSRLMSPRTLLPLPPRTLLPRRRPLLPLPPRTNSAPTLIKGGICEFNGLDVFRSRLAARMQSLGRAVRKQHSRQTTAVPPARWGGAAHLEDTHGDAVFVLEHLPRPVTSTCPFCAAEFMDVTNFATHIGNCPANK